MPTLRERKTAAKNAIKLAQAARKAALTSPAFRKLGPAIKSIDRQFARAKLETRVGILLEVLESNLSIAFDDFEEDITAALGFTDER